MPLIQPETIGNSFAHISYNDFTFPPTSRINIATEPVISSSNRSVRFLKFILTLETVIDYSSFSATDAAGSNPIGAANANTIGSTLSNGDRLDAITIPLFRKILAKGKRLIINGLGFGNIDVDNATSVRTPGIGFGIDIYAPTVGTPDLDNGPTPRITNIVWMRNARAFQLVWTCEFNISICDETEIDITKATLDSFNYSIHYAVNNDGTMYRTIQGTATIPNWVNNKQTTAINISASQVAGSVVDRILKSFPRPINCERTFHHLVDESRTKITFTIQDTEILSNDPYYPGTVRMNVAETVSNLIDTSAATASQDLTWRINFTGTIEVAPSYPKGLAWLALTSTIASRLRIQSALTDSYWQVTHSITEQIYGRTISFSFTYNAAFAIDEMFDFSGLFRPVNNPSDWEKWDKSRGAYQTPYGYNGGRQFRPNDMKDYVVTLCDENEASLDDELDTSKIDRVPIEKELDSTLLGTKVSQKASYAYFNNKIRMSSDYNTATVSVIGPGDAAQPYVEGVRGVEPFSGVPEQQVSRDLLAINRLGTNDVTPNQIQIRGAGKHYITISGRAERVRYPVVIPSLSSVGEDLPTPILETEFLEPSQIGGYAADGVPIHVASWIRVYSIPSLGNREIRVGNISPQFMTPDNANFHAGDYDNIT